MKVALVVDNPFRDLPGLVLVALSLCRRGARCHLVPMYFQQDVWALAPDFVLLNYLRNHNQAFAGQLMDAGIGVGVLDTEGGVIDSWGDYAQFLASDAGVRQRVAYFTWGPKLAEKVTAEGWFAPHNVVVTGSPRYDYYAPPWREAALRASAYVDAYPPPLVLVNGSFALCNPRFKTPEEEAQQLIDLWHFAPDDVRYWQTTQRETMHGMVALTNRLAGRFPEVTFVYRPHPFEKAETYEALLEPRPNLHLVKKGSVEGWILRARAVIQRNSSTSIDAALAGVPALMPTWIPTILQAPATVAISHACPSEEELARCLTAILAGRYEAPPELRRQLGAVVADWFHRADGRSHERLADAIVRRAPARGRRGRRRRCRDRVYGLHGPVPWKTRLRVALADAMGVSVHRTLAAWGVPRADHGWWPASEKFFSDEQVQALADAVLACDPRPARPPGLRAARSRGDYHFGYRDGHAVTVYPA
jgi:surface carbohydrate biosynthesis protein